MKKKKRKDEKLLNIWKIYGKNTDGRIKAHYKPHNKENTLSSRQQSEKQNGKSNFFK